MALAKPPHDDNPHVLRGVKHLDDAKAGDSLRYSLVALLCSRKEPTGLSAEERKADGSYLAYFLQFVQYNVWCDDSKAINI